MGGIWRHSELYLNERISVNSFKVLCHLKFESGLFLEDLKFKSGLKDGH
jgi:hypothetical protein